MHSRLTISGMMAVVVLAAVGFAAIRSGSDLWLRVIYSLVAMALLTATVLARYRSAFWYGFAVFGWGYFLLGLGPWVGLASTRTPENQPLNRMLLSYDVANYICLFSGNYQHNGQLYDYDLMLSNVGLSRILSKNRQPICHSILTLPFGFAGGSIAWLLASRRRND
jgi:hypothetical protein